MEKVLFTNSQGIQLVGLLDKVVNNGQIVVMGHGFTSSKKGRAASHVSKALSEAGINTLRFDFFGHGDSKGKFEDITISEGIDDALQAIEYAKQLGYKKIGLFGNSFGGIVGLATASMSKDVNSLCVLCPVSDFKSMLDNKFLERDIDAWKTIGKNIYKEKDGKRYYLKFDFYEDTKKWIMYDKAKNINCPTLIIHGDADKTVPLEQSKKTLPLIPNGKLEIIKGADHKFIDDKIMKNVCQIIVDWFK
jgi:pimeloyl-ACP methyl ester carboxylesterase